MLCDDVIADTVLRDLYDGLDRTYDKIRRAQKFVLSRDFATAADGLVGNIPELEKIAPFCRVPYPLTWIEWAHADRPHWIVEGEYGARPVDRDRHQLPTYRVGILLEQDQRASFWLTRLFWSTKETTISDSPHNTSLIAVSFDADKVTGSDPLTAATGFKSADYGLRMLGTLTAAAPHMARRLFEYAIEDWGGELRFMIAVLGLLNTRNVVETQRVDNEKVNVRRQHHGKRPLFSHHIIKVRPSIVVRGNTGPGDHRDLRLHFVRGHFKRRASGMFWWSMHTRGSIEHGMVSKDYELEEK